MVVLLEGIAVGVELIDRGEGIIGAEVGIGPGEEGLTGDVGVLVVVVRAREREFKGRFSKTLIWPEASAVTMYTSWSSTVISIEFPNTGTLIPLLPVFLVLLLGGGLVDSKGLERGGLEGIGWAWEE